MKAVYLHNFYVDKLGISSVGVKTRFIGEFAYLLKREKAK